MVEDDVAEVKAGKDEVANEEVHGIEVEDVLPLRRQVLVGQVRPLVPHGVA